MKGTVEGGKRSWGRKGPLFMGETGKRHSSYFYEKLLAIYFILSSISVGLYLYQQKK